MADARPSAARSSFALPFMPTPVDWLLILPVVATLAIWALYLSPAAPAFLQRPVSPVGAPWRAWALQLLPLAVGLAALVAWLAANRWDWPNLGLSRIGWSEGWRWIAVGASTGAGLAAVNLFIIMVLAPALFGSHVNHHLFYEAPHARLEAWVLLLVVVPAVAVLVELLFRGFLLGRLLVWMPAGAWGRWGAIVGAGLLFAWDPFLVLSFREWHWLGWSDGVVWGWLLYRSGTLLTPMVAHGVEVVLLYSVFRWLVA